MHQDWNVLSIDCIGLISGYNVFCKRMQIVAFRRGLFFYAQIHTDQNPSESLVEAHYYKMYYDICPIVACCSIQPCKNMMGKSGSSIVKVSVVNILGRQPIRKGNHNVKDPKCVCLFFFFCFFTSLAIS